MKILIFFSLLFYTIANAYFVKIGDIVTDSATGYQWQDNQIQSNDWQGAMTECASLSLNKQSDWRLPSYDELRTLLIPQGTVSSVFENFEDDTYWTSTTFAPGTNLNWTLLFGTGEVTKMERIYAANIICVRGEYIPASPTEDFLQRFFTNVYVKELTKEDFTYWSNLMKSTSAAHVVKQFVSSQEFLDLSLNDTQYVELLSDTILGHLSTKAQKAEYLNDILNNNEEREAIMYKLLNSQEFSDLSNTMGVTAIRDIDQANTSKNSVGINPAIINYLLF